MWRWFRAWSSRSEVCSPSLRPVAPIVGDPYREAPPIAPLDRAAEPCTLAAVCDALAQAQLAFRPRRRGFQLLGPDRSRTMTVVVRDTARVVPPEMACDPNAPELLLDLALAVVPLFGPMIAEVRFAGAVFVDGTRDRGALGEEAATRIQQVSRRVAARAPISFPILVDLARRMRQPR